QDQSFGQFPRGSQEQRERLAIRKPWAGNNAFLDKVFKAEPFKAAYLAKMREFTETSIQPPRIAPQVDELPAVVRDAIKEESNERLTNLNNAVEGKPVTSSMAPGMNGPGNL